MDLQEFTTIDEVGEEDDSVDNEVRIKSIDKLLADHDVNAEKSSSNSPVPPNTAAEEIDYLNKIILDIENSENEVKSCGDPNSSTNIETGLLIQTDSLNAHKDKTNLVCKDSISLIVKNLMDETNSLCNSINFSDNNCNSNSLSQFESVSKLNQHSLDGVAILSDANGVNNNICSEKAKTMDGNSNISDVRQDKGDISINMLPIILKENNDQNVSKNKLQSEKGNSLVGKQELKEMNDNTLNFSVNNNKDSCQTTPLESDLKAVDKVRDENCNEGKGGSSRSENDDDYINITLPLKISCIKNEPPDTEIEEEVDFGEYFNDPAEDFTYESLNSLKQEDNEYQISDTTIPFQGNLETVTKFELDTDDNSCASCFVPKIHFKIKKKLYSKEQLTAAVIMAQSSLASVIDMDMFSNLPKGLPVVKLIKLENFTPSVMSFEDHEYIDIFFVKYGRNPKKWKRYFKVKKRKRHKENDKEKGVRVKTKEKRHKKKHETHIEKIGNNNGSDNLEIEILKKKYREAMKRTLTHKGDSKSPEGFCGFNSSFQVKVKHTQNSNSEESPQNLKLRESPGNSESKKSQVSKCKKSPKVENFSSLYDIDKDKETTTATPKSKIHLKSKKKSMKAMLSTYKIKSCSIVLKNVSVPFGASSVIKNKLTSDYSNSKAELDPAKMENDHLHSEKLKIKRENIRKLEKCETKKLFTSDKKISKHILLKKKYHVGRRHSLSSSKGGKDGRERSASSDSIGTFRSSSSDAENWQRPKFRKKSPVEKHKSRSPNLGIEDRRQREKSLSVETDQERLKKITSSLDSDKKRYIERPVCSNSNKEGLTCRSPSLETYDKSNKEQLQSSDSNEESVQSISPSFDLYKNNRQRSLSSNFDNGRPASRSTCLDSSRTSNKKYSERFESRKISRRKLSLHSDSSRERRQSRSPSPDSKKECRRKSPSDDTIKIKSSKRKKSSKIMREKSSNLESFNKHNKNILSKCSKTKREHRRHSSSVDSTKRSLSSGSSASASDNECHKEKLKFSATGKLERKTSEKGKEREQDIGIKMNFKSKSYISTDSFSDSSDSSFTTAKSVSKNKKKSSKETVKLKSFSKKQEGSTLKSKSLSKRPVENTSDSDLPAKMATKKKKPSSESRRKNNSRSSTPECQKYISSEEKGPVKAKDTQTNIKSKEKDRSLKTEAETILSESESKQRDELPGSLLHKKTKSSSSNSNGNQGISASNENHGMSASSAISQNNIDVELKNFNNSDSSKVKAKESENYTKAPSSNSLQAVSSVLRCLDENNLKKYDKLGIAKFSDILVDKNEVNENNSKSDSLQKSNGSDSKLKSEAILSQNAFSEIDLKSCDRTQSTNSCNIISDITLPNNNSCISLISDTLKFSEPNDATNELSSESAEDSNIHLNTDLTLNSVHDTSINLKYRIDSAQLHSEMLKSDNSLSTNYLKSTLQAANKSCNTDLKSDTGILSSSNSVNKIPLKESCSEKINISDNSSVDVSMKSLSVTNIDEDIELHKNEEIQSKPPETKTLVSGAEKKFTDSSKSPNKNESVNVAGVKSIYIAGPHDSLGGSETEISIKAKTETAISEVEDKNKDGKEINTLSTNEDNSTSANKTELISSTNSVDSLKKHLSESIQKDSESPLSFKGNELIKSENEKMKIDVDRKVNILDESDKNGSSRLESSCIAKMDNKSSDNQAKNLQDKQVNLSVKGTLVNKDKHKLFIKPVESEKILKSKNYCDKSNYEQWKLKLVHKVESFERKYKGFKIKKCHVLLEDLQHNILYRKKIKKEKKYLAKFKARMQVDKSIRKVGDICKNAKLSSERDLTSEILKAKEQEPKTLAEKNSSAPKQEEKLKVKGLTEVSLPIFTSSFKIPKKTAKERYDNKPKSLIQRQEEKQYSYYGNEQRKGFYDYKEQRRGPYDSADGRKSYYDSNRPWDKSDEYHQKPSFERFPQRLSDSRELDEKHKVLLNFNPDLMMRDYAKEKQKIPITKTGAPEYESSRPRQVEMKQLSYSGSRHQNEMSSQRVKNICDRERALLEEKPRVFGEAFRMQALQKLEEKNKSLTDKVTSQDKNHSSGKTILEEKNKQVSEEKVIPLDQNTPNAIDKPLVPEHPFLSKDIYKNSLAKEYEMAMFLKENLKSNEKLASSDQNLDSSYIKKIDAHQTIEDQGYSESSEIHGDKSKILMDLNTIESEYYGADSPMEYCNSPQSFGSPSLEVSEKTVPVISEKNLSVESLKSKVLSVPEFSSQMTTQQLDHFTSQSTKNKFITNEILQHSSIYENFDEYSSEKNEFFKNLGKLDRKGKVKLYIKYKKLYNEAKKNFFEEPGDMHESSKIKKFKELNKRRRSYYDLKVFLYEEKKQKNASQKIKHELSFHKESKDKTAGSTVAIPYSPSALPVFSAVAGKSEQASSISHGTQGEDLDEPYSPSSSPVIPVLPKPLRFNSSLVGNMPEMDIKVKIVDAEVQVSKSLSPAPLNIISSTASLEAMKKGGKVFELPSKENLYSDKTDSVEQRTEENIPSGKNVSVFENEEIYSPGGSPFALEDVNSSYFTNSSKFKEVLLSFTQVAKEGQELSGASVTKSVDSTVGQVDKNKAPTKEQMQVAIQQLALESCTDTGSADNNVNKILSKAETQQGKITVTGISSTIYSETDKEIMKFFIGDSNTRYTLNKNVTDYDARLEMPSQSPSLPCQPSLSDQQTSTSASEPPILCQQSALSSHQIPATRCQPSPQVITQALECNISGTQRPLSSQTGLLYEVPMSQPQHPSQPTVCVLPQSSDLPVAESSQQLKQTHIVAPGHLTEMPASQSHASFANQAQSFAHLPRVPSSLPSDQLIPCSRHLVFPGIAPVQQLTKPAVSSCEPVPIQSSVIYALPKQPYVSQANLQKVFSPVSSYSSMQSDNQAHLNALVGSSLTKMQTLSNELAYPYIVPSAYNYQHMSVPIVGPAALTPVHHGIPPVAKPLPAKPLGVVQETVKASCQAESVSTTYSVGSTKFNTNLSLATALLLPPPPPPSSAFQELPCFDAVSSEAKDRPRSATKTSNLSEVMSEFFGMWDDSSDDQRGFNQSAFQNHKDLDNLYADGSQNSLDGKFYEENPLAHDLIEKVQGVPLVGLQYILEVQKEVNPKVEDCSYICGLCSKKMSSATLVAHVKSVPHRLKFTECASQELHNKFGKMEVKQWTASLVKEFTQSLLELEEKIGRQRLAVSTENSMNSGLNFLKDRIATVLRTGFEAPLPQVRKVTNSAPQNKSKAGSDSQESSRYDKFSHRKPSPSRPVKRPIEAVEKPGPKFTKSSDYKSREQERERERVRDRERGRERNGERDSRSKTGRKGSSPHRKRSPPNSRYSSARKKSRTRSPVRRSDRERDKGMNTRENASYNNKLMEFRAEETRLQNENMRFLDRYTKDPEAHPRYKFEWEKFWDKRYREIRQKGMTVNNQTIKTEWLQFWPNHIKETCRLEFIDKRKELLKRFRIEDPDPQSRPFDNIRSRNSLRNEEYRQSPNESFGEPRRISDVLGNDRYVTRNIGNPERLYSKGERPMSPWEKRPPNNHQPEIPKETYEAGFSVVRTLRLLTDLEDQLGSLFPATNTLLNKAVDLADKRGSKPIQLFKDNDNLVLLRLANVKLSSQVSSGILDALAAAKTLRAIEATNWLLSEAEKYFPDLQSKRIEGLGLDLNLISTATIGMNTVQIAEYIAQQLFKVGKSDVDQSVLQDILTTISENHNRFRRQSHNTNLSLAGGEIKQSQYNMHEINRTNQEYAHPYPKETIKNEGTVQPLRDDRNIQWATAGSGSDKPQEPRNTLGPVPALFPSGVQLCTEVNKQNENVRSNTVQKANENAQEKQSRTALSLLQSYDGDDDEEGIGSSKDMDSLSLEELQGLLSNFRKLNPQEQQNLTNYLKKLEATDNKKVTKLRSMMQSSKPITQVRKTEDASKSVSSENFELQKEHMRGFKAQPPLTTNRIEPENTSSFSSTERYPRTDRHTGSQGPTNEQGNKFRPYMYQRNEGNYSKQDEYGTQQNDDTNLQNTRKVLLHNPSTEPRFESNRQSLPSDLQNQSSQSGYSYSGTGMQKRPAINKQTNIANSNSEPSYGEHCTSPRDAPDIDRRNFNSRQPLLATPGNDFELQRPNLLSEKGMEPHQNKEQQKSLQGPRQPLLVNPNIEQRFPNPRHSLPGEPMGPQQAFRKPLLSNPPSTEARGPLGNPAATPSRAPLLPDPSRDFDSRPIDGSYQEEFPPNISDDGHLQPRRNPEYDDSYENLQNKDKMRDNSNPEQHRYPLLQRPPPLLGGSGFKSNEYRLFRTLGDASRNFESEGRSPVSPGSRLSSEFAQGVTPSFSDTRHGSCDPHNSFSSRGRPVRGESSFRNDSKLSKQPTVFSDDIRKFSKRGMPFSSSAMNSHQDNFPPGHRYERGGQDHYEENWQSGSDGFVSESFKKFSQEFSGRPGRTTEASDDHQGEKQSQFEASYRPDAPENEGNFDSRPIPFKPPSRFPRGRGRRGNMF